MAAYNIAFAAPDNAAGAISSKARPVDMVHLSRQTMGDKALEIEVLRAFARQVRIYMTELSGPDRAKTSATAHRLKGSAASIGAFELAEAAGRLEAKPADPALLAAVSAAVIDVHNFILALDR